MNKKYNVGNWVWWANPGMTEITKPCIVCYGNLKVTLILGNNDHVELPCDYCGKGYEGPKGYTKAWEYLSDVKKVMITNIRASADLTGEKREYLNNNTYLYEEDIFDTKEEAEERVKEIIEKREIEQNTKAENLKKQVSKSFSWNAGYHLREAKKAEKQAEYHKTKAKLCKERITK